MSAESLLLLLGAISGVLFSFLVMIVVMPKIDNACELPMPPLPSYWLGHAWQFLDIKRLLRTNLDWFHDLGDVFQIWIVHRQVVVTANPEDVVHILGKTSIFERPAAQTAVFNDLQPDNFQTMPRDLHRVHRKTLRNAISQSKMHGFESAVSREADAFAKRLRNVVENAPGTPINLTPEVVDTTFTVLLSAVLGSAMDSSKRRDFTEASQSLLRQILIEYFTYPLRRLFSFTGVRRTLFRRHRDVFRYAEEILQARENEPEEALAKRSPDVLDIIRELDQSDRRRQLSNITMFAIAGFESSSEAIAWAVYEICGRPEIAKEIQCEIDEVFGNRSKINYEDVQKLDCLRRAWTETLRLHPAAGFMLRVAKEDSVLPGSRVHIPAGVQVGILIAGAQRNPRYVSAPEKFRPERWVPGAVDRPSASAFVPYSCGPERCPGQALADYESVAILAALFRDFDVELACKREEVVGISDWTERARSAAPGAPAGDTSWSLPVLLKPRTH